MKAGGLGRSGAKIPKNPLASDGCSWRSSTAAQGFFASHLVKDGGQDVGRGGGEVCAGCWRGVGGLARPPPSPTCAHGAEGIVHARAKREAEAPSEIGVFPQYHRGE